MPCSIHYKQNGFHLIESRRDVRILAQCVSAGYKYLHNEESAVGATDYSFDSSVVPPGLIAIFLSINPPRLTPRANIYRPYRTSGSSLPHSPTRFESEPIESRRDVRFLAQCVSAGYKYLHNEESAVGATDYSFDSSVVPPGLIAIFLSINPPRLTPRANIYRPYRTSGSSLPHSPTRFESEPIESRRDVRFLAQCVSAGYKYLHNEESAVGATAYSFDSSVVPPGFIAIFLSINPPRLTPRANIYRPYRTSGSSYHIHPLDLKVSRLNPVGMSDF